MGWREGRKEGGGEGTKKGSKWDTMKILVLLEGTDKHMRKKMQKYAIKKKKGNKKRSNGIRGTKKLDF